VTDRRILLAAAFLRALATGMVGVLLGIYLAARGLPPAESGLVVSAGLAGMAAAALAVTVFADRLGRRRTLVAVSLLAAAGGAALLVAGSAPLAAAAAFVGMVNGMGRDRGAALILDVALLPATVAPAGRTRAFAWYNVLQDAGHAVGGLAAGLPTLLRAEAGLAALASLQVALAVAVAIALLLAALYARLSTAAEAPSGPRARVSPESRRILWRISALFSLDSLAGGFLTASLLAYFFFERFGASEVVIGTLFFVARLANAGSHLAAAWLARRIGLVPTMVFTHIPSSLLLASVAWAPSFGIAAALFLLREALVEMDVPTRQSYVMAVVRPEERTVASGVTQLVKVAAWAVAPAFAGVIVGQGALAWPLVIGAGMKIAYDLMLWGAFRRVKAPEEG
jgi:MFS family permease